MDETDRLKLANEFIESIASCGRQFFRHGDRVARFEIDHNRRVWLIDEYSGARVFTHYRGRWRKFTGGGTLRALVERLRDFIKRGDKLPTTTLGPWRDWVCGDGNLWGYGEDMARVRADAARLGIV